MYIDIYMPIYISPNITSEGNSLGNLMCQRRNLRIKSHITGLKFFLPSKRGDINLTLFLESNLRKLYAVIHDIHGDQFQDSAADI